MSTSASDNKCTVAIARASASCDEGERCRGGVPLEVNTALSNCAIEVCTHSATSELVSGRVRLLVIILVVDETHSRFPFAVGRH